MATLLVRCTCNENLTIDQEFIGKHMKCPKCGETFVVPAVTQAAGSLSSAATPNSVPVSSHAGGLQSPNPTVVHSALSGPYWHRKPNLLAHPQALIVASLVGGSCLVLLTVAAVGYFMLKDSSAGAKQAALHPRDEHLGSSASTVESPSPYSRSGLSRRAPRKVEDGFRATVYPSRRGVLVTQNLTEIAAKHHSYSPSELSMADRSSSSHAGSGAPVEQSVGNHLGGSSNDMSLADLVELVEPSVVLINVTGVNGDSSIGSGFVIDASGHIVTNYHVVEGAKSIRIESSAGEGTDAVGFVSVSPQADTCILKVAPESLPCRPLPVADSIPRKGEKVAAFGSPLGFSFSATEGIVSGYRSGSEIKEALDDFTGKGAYESLGYSTNTKWIQTSAAISGGNSGGPLVNMKGQVVGINTWSNGKGQNLNFAVAKETFIKLYESRKGVQPIAALPKPSAKRLRYEIGQAFDRIFGSEKIVPCENERFVKVDSDLIVREYSGHTKGIHDLAVSSDGKYLATCGVDKLVTVFDLKSGQGLYRIETDKFATRGVEFAHGSKYLITLRNAGLEPSIKFRDASTGKDAHTGVITVQPNEALVLAASTDGRRVLASWQPDTVAMANYDSLMHTASAGLIEGWTISAAHFLPNEAGCIVGSTKGTLAEFYLRGNSVSVVSQKIDAHRGPIRAITSSGQYRSLVSGGEDGAIYVWTTRKANGKWGYRKLSESGPPVFCISYSPDQKYIAAGRSNGTIEIYDIKKFDQIRSFHTGSDAITAVQFHPSGQYLIVGSDRGKVSILALQ